MARPLVLFTAAFPYGIKSETFLETEIEVLSRHFQRIIIVPCHTDGQRMRALPANVEVSLSIVERKKRSGREILANNFGRFCAVYTACLFSSRWNAYHYTRHARHYASRLIGELEYYELIDVFIKEEGLEDAVFYTYWFEHCLTALSMLKRSGRLTRLVARAHGFDLYDERNHGLPVAFRDFKMRYVDRVFCISRHGADYLRSKTEPKHHAKVLLNYLGVRAADLAPAPEVDAAPLIVSVCSLNAFKRVDLLARALRHYPGSLRWIHFGSGPDYERIQALCRDLPANIRWELAGHVENPAILDFYAKHPVSLFVSLSESEGLPVSMMEAISFGIPVLACRICGIPEIVIDERTGLLLKSDLDEREACAGLEQALAVRFDRQEIRRFFLSTFEAEKNYSSFCKALDF